MTDLKKNIVWLASYPKSGNTWFRVFLNNILSLSDDPVSINELDKTLIASGRGIFDKYLGIDSSDLTNNELNNLRPEIFKCLSNESENQLFIKTHDAFEMNNLTQPIFPSEITKAVIYFIRNPLDVVVSFSFHNNISIKESIKCINSDNFSMYNVKGKVFDQMQQNILCWSDHVISWVDKSKLPILILRYEDMLEKPLETFSDALRFIEFSSSESNVLNALNKSSFKNLQIQESQIGFRERSIKSKAFFRSGTKDQWKNHLSKSETYEVIHKHKAVMERFNYL